jgi:Tfp pilus assembly protein PilV
MRRRSGAARGSALIELMVSAVILLIAVVGFLAAMRDAVNATAVGHRRTEATLLRTGLIERLTVARRQVVADLAGVGWRLEGCYDVEARLVGENTTWAAAYACPSTASYRRWLSVSATPGVAGVDQRAWAVALYVERIDQGCDPTTRYGSIGCTGADLYLTD